MSLPVGRPASSLHSLTEATTCWYTSGYCWRTSSELNPNRSMTIALRVPASTSRPLRYGRIRFSRPGRLWRPNKPACSGLTMKPAPCSLTPGEQMNSFERRATVSVTSVPTVKSALMGPIRSRSSTDGASLSSPASRTTSRSTPSCLPAAATVMAIRTAAASRVTLVHG